MSQVRGFFAPFPLPKKSSSSSTLAAHHDASARDDLWVQITTDDDRTYCWNRPHWEMPPGIRPGWVMSRDGLFAHIETQNVLTSIAGMH